MSHVPLLGHESTTLSQPLSEGRRQRTRTGIPADGSSWVGWGSRRTCGCSSLVASSTQTAGCPILALSLRLGWEKTNPPQGVPCRPLLPFYPIPCHPENARAWGPADGSSSVGWSRRICCCLSLQGSFVLPITVRATRTPTFRQPSPKVFPHLPELSPTPWVSPQRGPQATKQGPWR